MHSRKLHDSAEETATHFVWRNGVMEMVWRTNGESRNVWNCRGRHDLALGGKKIRGITNRSVYGAPRFFHQLPHQFFPVDTFKELFTGERFATLISCLRQLMTCRRNSRIVAAVADGGGRPVSQNGLHHRRGRRPGQQRTDGGRLWVIGYWRPEQHFEVNVWTVL